MVVRKLKPLLIEAVVRGYIIGSGWKDYRQTGAVCGIKLPPGLKQAEKLPQPIFTPASKAPIGEHDENITFDEAVRTVGSQALAERVREVSIRLYSEAAEYAAIEVVELLDVVGHVHEVDHVADAEVTGLLVLTLNGNSRCWASG